MIIGKRIGLGMIGCVLTLGILCGPGVLTAQGQENATAEKSAPPAPTPISLSEVVYQAGSLSQRLTTLKAKVASIDGLQALDQQLAEAKKRTSQFETRLKNFKTEDLQSYQQLAGMKGELRDLTDTVNRVSSSLKGTIQQIETARHTWTDEKDRWRKWREQLAGDLSINSVRDAFSRANGDIGDALDLLTAKLEPMLAVQQKAGDLKARLDILQDRVDTRMTQQRGGNLRSDTPIILSLAYLRQLIDLLHEPGKLIKPLPFPKTAFFKDKGWVIALQAIAFIALLSLLQHYRAKLLGHPGRRFLGKRTVSVALLVPVFSVTFLYGSPPTMWRMLIQTLAGVATARLMTAFLQDAWIKRAIYILLAVMIGFQLLLIMGVPLALVRLFILVWSVAGTIYYAWRTLKGRAAGMPAWHLWLLRLITLVFAVIALADIIGLGGFSAQLMDSAIRTAMLLIMGWVIVRLARVMLELAAEWIPLGNFTFLRSNANLILARIIWATNAVIIFFVAANLLVAWKLYAIPVEAIHDILAFGVPIGNSRITVGLVLVAGIILYGAFTLSWFLQGFIMENVLSQGQMDTGVRLSIVRLMHYALVLVGFLIALSSMGFELQNITIIGGALGVGIGFGMQTIVNNFVSGLILLFERPIKVGDVIQLSDGQQGRVTNLGLRATTVQTFDRAEIVVPNGDLIASQVTNWTLGDRSMRVIIPIGVAYGSDVEAVMRVLTAVAKENDQVLKDPEPMVLFINFGDSSLDFQLRVWIADFNERRIIQSALIREIDRRFRLEKIEIPFPQRDLHLRSVDAQAAERLAGGEGRPATPLPESE